MIDSIENIVAACDTEKAEELHKIIRAELEKTGILNIVTKNDKEINNIKAIGSWGEGFYYGKLKNQKNFSKSVSVFSIKTINNKNLHHGISL